MASKEAKSDTPAATGERKNAKAKKEKEEAEVFGFEFALAKDKIGVATTNKQVKAKVSEAFLGYGAFDQCQVKGDVGEDRTVIVFFARLFGKGQPAWEALSRGEKPTVSLYDEQVEFQQTSAKPSGGGATSGTSSRPKKEAKAGEKKAGPRRREGKDGEAKTEGKGEGKDGAAAATAGAPGAGAGAAGAEAKKDGERPKRPKKEEVKGPSLQRGRANIGGKLGPVSKVRLAKQEKERKAKEKKEREDRGEKVEDEKKEEKEELHAPLPKKGAKVEGKKEGGKKEGGKKEGGKAEGGKKEGAKAEGGKKEGAKKGK